MVVVYQIDVYSTEDDFRYYIVIGDLFIPYLKKYRTKINTTSITFSFYIFLSFSNRKVNITVVFIINFIILIIFIDDHCLTSTKRNSRLWTSCS